MNQDIVESLKDFIAFDPIDNEKKASIVPSSFFREKSEVEALKTFKTASSLVPAYKDFLRLNKIDPEKINNFDDFKKLPLTDKKNYLTKYPIKDLLINGSFIGKTALTSSSGSSGTPLFWPRYPVQDFGASKGFDSYLVNTFGIDKISTLHLNCSGMGVWTAGDYVSLLIKYLSYKYNHNSSCSPGIDIDNSLRLLEIIAPEFQQTIIYSYPPFAKDIIDRLPLKLAKKLNIRLVVYGEPYTENWRKYILDKLGINNGEYYYVSSVLGSSEGGLIGVESKFCTYTRILSHNNKTLCKAFFGEERVPSLIQYNPMSKFIEIIGNNIVMTSLGGLPLIRYDTHDYGSVLTKEEISNLYTEVTSKNVVEEAKKQNILVTSLPYLYVFGRSDYTASIYGVLIYPEVIKDILTTLPFSKFFSGKFVMSTIEDIKSNQYLNIILETKNGIESGDVAIAAIEKIFADHIRIYSSEYAKLLASAGERVFPKVDVRNYGDETYFSSRNKQKYLI